MRNCTYIRYNPQLSSDGFDEVNRVCLFEEVRRTTCDEDAEDDPTTTIAPAPLVITTDDSRVELDDGDSSRPPLLLPPYVLDSGTRSCDTPLSIHSEIQSLVREALCMRVYNTLIYVVMYECACVCI